MERNKYVNRDNLCAKAIEGHKETSSILNWLILCAKLFNAILYNQKNYQELPLCIFRAKHL